MRYLDISILAERLGMDILETWAHSQLKYFFKSTSWALEHMWEEGLLLQITRAFKTPAVKHTDTVDGIQILLCSILNYSSSREPTPPYLEICITWYKETAFSGISGTVFGWIFAFILSLGHRSSIWADKLSRDERLVLYSAQAELVNLSGRSDLFTSWIRGEDRVQQGNPLPEPGAFRKCCPKCLSYCKSAWHSSYGRMGSLDSTATLEDIRKIIRLWDYRQMFAQAVGSSSWPCRAGCGKKVLDFADTYSNLLFRQFACIHAHFVKYVLFMVL